MLESERDRQLTAVIEEWKDLRDEIKRRIDQRTLITQIMITLVSALLTAAFASQNFYIVGIIPFAAAYCLNQIKATYFMHSSLVKYIREEIEERKMSMIFPTSEIKWLSWETYYNEKVSKSEKERASRRRFYNLFELSLYTGCGVVFSSHAFLNLEIRQSIALVVLFWVFGFGVLWLSWIKDPYKQKS